MHQEDKELKKHVIVWLLISTFIIMSVGCASNDTQTPITGNPVSIVQVDAAPLQTPVPGQHTPADEIAARGANDFAFRLSALLAQDVGDDNLIVSPYSIWLPLAALLNATHEAYQDALLEALGASGISVDDVNRAAARMLFDLTNSETDWLANQLHIANAIFVDHNMTLRQDFAQTFADYFRGTVMNVDFHSQEAADAVNQWAYDNTEGHITDIIQQFDPDTVAAIANAIYFSDRWLSEFDPDNTEQDIFHSPTGESLAYFMLREGMTYYFEDDALQAVRLPFTYGGGLYILLPRYGSATELLMNMTAERFEYIHNNSYETFGKLLLPRFSLESKFDLLDTLDDLGIQLVCFGSAPITDLLYESQSLFISDAVQKAMIEVDEKGTTAAAVTVMAMAMSGPPPSPFPPFEMICDRPFAFVLYQQTHAGGAQVLFTGIVQAP
jgi:serpin B